MRKLTISALTFAAALAGTASAGTFPDSHDQAPATWRGPIFRLSQDFPTSNPASATPAPTYPWQQYNFRTQPDLYIKAVYDYVLEGNREVDWVVQNNAVRKWYHAPWMHYGDHGREYVRGMTRERTTPAAQAGKGELGPQQTSCAQNWAVGFLNEPGGYIMGQVWADPNAPDPLKALFPEGTVAAKLLFTAATVDQVPYLNGSLEWDANIDTLLAADPKCAFTGGRKVQKVRLLQMDLAIRDSRANDSTGWIFATYSFDGNRPGAGWWEKMVPVGVMWGNDPKLDQAAFNAGQRVKESWINPNSATPQHLGFLGRLNGPVDNPISACLSCHMTAEVPARSSMTPPAPSNPNLMRWFDNLPAGNSFDQRSIGTDYNLQIALGIQNFQLWKQTAQGGYVAPAPRPPAAPAPSPAAVAAGPALSTTVQAEELTIDGERVYRVGR